MQVPWALFDLEMTKTCKIITRPKVINNSTLVHWCFVLLHFFLFFSFFFSSLVSFSPYHLSRVYFTKTKYVGSVVDNRADLKWRGEGGEGERGERTS